MIGVFSWVGLSQMNTCPTDGIKTCPNLPQDGWVNLARRSRVGQVE